MNTDNNEQIVSAVPIALEIDNRISILFNLAAYYDLNTIGISQDLSWGSVIDPNTDYISACLNDVDIFEKSPAFVFTRTHAEKFTNLLFHPDKLQFEIKECSVYIPKGIIHKSVMAELSHRPMSWERYLRVRHRLAPFSKVITKVLVRSYANS